jgi:RNA polymerase sigma-70 factor (family 1)
MGDEQAYTAFFGQYHGKLFGYIQRLVHNHHVAEELLLDVFLKLWQGRDALPEIRNVDRFLFKVAYNKSIDFLRAARDNQHLSDLAWQQLQVPAGEDPSTKMIREEYERLLRDAIGLLPAQRQKVYKMHMEEGKAYKQIADELSISPNTVNMHMYEARRFIREHLVSNLDLAIVLVLLAKM